MKAYCNITGIEFEANSKRQKNDARVSNLLENFRLAKDGTYSIIRKNLEAKKGSFNNFEEVAEFVNSGKALKNQQDYPGDYHTDIDYY